jgi:hypothetical protein
MSNEQGSGMPAGPPWSLDDIADVHAGVYPPETEARLRAAMANDPEARSVLAALGSVVDELSLLPVPSMPPQYAARLDVAITAESQRRTASRGAAPPATPFAPPPLRPAAPPAPQPGPPVDELARRRGAVPPLPDRVPMMSAPAPTGPAGPPPGTVRSIDSARSKRRGLLVGLGAAAAVAAIAAVTFAVVNSSSSPNNTAGNTGSVAPTGPTTAPNSGGGAQALKIDPNNMQQAYLEVGTTRSGALTDPITFAGCAAQLKITGTDVLGVADGDYQGRGATVITVAVSPTQAEVIVVAAGCSAAGADVLQRATVAR